MRLVTRMSASVVFASLGVFGGFGGWLAVKEASDLRRSTEREATFLATSLQVGVENALRDRQLSDVEKASLRLDRVGAGIDVYVFDTKGTPLLAPPWGTRAVPERVTALLDRVWRSRETQLDYGDESRPDELVLATPLLSEEGELLGGLVLVRPLDDVRADLFYTRAAVAATVGSFTLIAAALAYAIGERRLGRPLAGLVEGMRRVRQGELTEPLVETGDDELVAVAAAFNAMLRDLREARGRVEAESEARREALHSLQAADRLVTVGQLSAAVAHEIGSPLQVLLGRARALAERPDDVAHTRRVADILVQESERITRIVSQLLTLTRRQVARRESTDLVSAANTVVTLLEIESRRRRIRVSSASSGDGTAFADPDQMHQVLLNLLTNGLSACAPGGHVHLRVTGAEHQVQVEVEDDGVGMDAETERRAFEPLFTTRGGEGGAGLGLTVVRSIVLDHRGRITFDTAPGRGTRVTVVLPRREGA